MDLKAMLNASLRPDGTMATSKTKASFTHVTRPSTAAINFLGIPALVRVGTPHTIFHVNEELLCSGSEFFKSALKKEWRKGQMHVVELPEQKPDTFNVYLNWLYQRQVFVGSVEYEDERGIPWQNCIEAYALGDLLMDVDFKDATMDAMMTSMLSKAEHKGGCWIPGAEKRRLLYEVTPPGCKARKMLAHRIAEDAVSVIKDTEDPAMLHDIMQKLAEKDRVWSITAAARCDFHEHEQGEANCYRKRFARPLIFNGL